MTEFRVAGDLLGLMEEYAVLLHNRPRMMLQVALNMPDHTGVYVQGRYLEMRRRRRCVPPIQCFRVCGVDIAGGNGTSDALACSFISWALLFLALGHLLLVSLSSPFLVPDHLNPSQNMSMEEKLKRLHAG